MTCVTPAWDIFNVINTPRLRAQRHAADQEWEEKFIREGLPPEAENLSANRLSVGEDAEPASVPPATPLAGAPSVAVPHGVDPV
jgi:hypothetical protein